MSDDFKATFCGAEYHNIDGTGWPDAVVMENQGSVLDGTYESRTYYPERTCSLRSRYTSLYCYECSECGKGMKPEWAYCPRCGAKVMER